MKFQTQQGHVTLRAEADSVDKMKEAGKWTVSINRLGLKDRTGKQIHALATDLMAVAAEVGYQAPETKT